MTRYPDGPAASPGFLLWHVTLAWQRGITAVLELLGLTHVQFVLLAGTWWLEGQGQAPNQLELARQAGIDARMASQVVRKLETKNLVRREVDRDDTRARRVRLTAKGRELVKRALPAVEQADLEFFGAETAGVTSLLQRLIGHGPPPGDGSRGAQ